MYTKRFSVLWAVCASILFFLTYCYLFIYSSTQATIPSIGPGNSTLGFGEIYVLSAEPDTWRVQGLKMAANMVGIDFDVFTPPYFSDEEINPWVTEEDDADAIRAAHGHAALLDRFLSSDHDTALIFEDDVDFDINIKSQMILLSEIMLQEEKITMNSSDPYDQDFWDILWLGHAGIELANGAETVHYHDPYSPPWERTTATFNDYYKWPRDSDAPQELIRGVAPLSSYAYAITRKAAKRVRDRVRRAPSGFDGILHVACKGLQERCVAPVPEKFHHQQVDGMRRLHVQGDQSTKQDLDWYLKRHKYTYNLQWSARCNAARTGEVIGDKWQCLPTQYDHRV